MKKLIFLLVMACSVLKLSAEESIVIKSGDASIVKDATIVASVVFDYSNTMLDGNPLMEQLKSRGEDFVRDWPQESKECEAEFVIRWNKKNKKGLQVTADEGKSYRMVVTVDQLDMGSFAASFLLGMGAGGAKMSGKVNLYKEGEADPVLSISVDGQTGKSEYSEQGRRTSLYKELVDDMLDVLKEANK